MMNVKRVILVFLAILITVLICSSNINKVNLYKLTSDEFNSIMNKITDNEVDSNMIKLSVDDNDTNINLLTKCDIEPNINLSRVKITNFTPNEYKSIYDQKITTQGTTVQNITLENKLKENSANPKSTISIYDMKQEDLSKYISFNDYIVSIPYNTNPSSSLNKSIKIYGTILTSDSPEVINSAFTSKFITIKLYSDNLKVAVSNSYQVKTFSSNNGCGIQLTLDVDSLLVEQEEIKITSIELIQSNDFALTIPTGKFYITQYKEIDNTVSIIDSPLKFTEPVKKDSSVDVVYSFLTINENYNSNYDIKVEIPEKLNEYLQIESINFNEDEVMKEEVKQVFYYDLTLRQKENLKVVNIVVRYHKKIDTMIFIQPRIKLNITGKYQYISPFEPLLL